MTGRWFRDIYRDAVWESEELTSQEKAVAETYARHARDTNDEKSATADLAWMTYPRIMAKAGIGRRANVSSAVAGLVAGGWLTVVREASRRPTLYRLTIPACAGSSDGGTRDGSSDGGTTVVPKITSGSSTSCAGSSDGGTQPLRPLETSPSVFSLSGDLPSVPAPCDPGEEDRERDGSTSSSTSNRAPQQQMVIEADCPEHLAQLVVEYLEAKHGVRGLGWWNTVRDRGHIRGHVQDGIAANTPQVGEGEDDTPCPLHSRFPLTNCGVCWADVQGGDDPYRGREHERPAGWWAMYNQQPRTSERGQVAPRVNMPEGTHTAQWNRRRQQHGSAAARKFQQAQDLAAELDAEYGNHRPDGPTADPTRILDHDAEATR